MVHVFTLKFANCTIFSTLDSLSALFHFSHAWSRTLPSAMLLADLPLNLAHLRSSARLSTVCPRHSAFQLHLYSDLSITPLVLNTCYSSLCCLLHWAMTSPCAVTCQQAQNVRDVSCVCEHKRHWTLVSTQCHSQVQPDIHRSH